MTSLDITAFEHPHNDQSTTHDADTTIHQLSQTDRGHRTPILQALSYEQTLQTLQQAPLILVREILNELKEAGYATQYTRLTVDLGLVTHRKDLKSNYLHTGVFEHVKSRLGWIVSLSLLGIFSGMIIASYEDALSALVILAIYMPVMADTGGNVGAQASTLLIQSMATGEITTRDWARVLWKEFRVSLIMAAALISIILIRVMGFGSDVDLPGDITLLQVAIAVSTAMAIQVISSSFLGAILPVFIRSLQLDPAVIVAPVLTSLVDMTGMLVYFFITTTMLNI